MNENELLSQVKTGLSIRGDYNNNVLKQKMLAVTTYMKNAGITDEHLYSDLGIACICVGVTDLWNLTAGDIKFSPAFNLLMEQLMVVSLPEGS